MEEALIPFRYSIYWLAVWLAAGITGFVALAMHPGRWRALGIGLLSVPVWTAIWGFIDSIPALADPGSVLQPASPDRLARMYYRSFLIDLGYIGAGFLALYKHHNWFGPLTTTRLASFAQECGVPLGRGEKASLVAGYLGFPLLFLGTAGASFLLGSVEALNNGDESNFWINLEPYHVVMLSISAGVTEELVYRAVLMVGLLRATQSWGCWSAPVAVAGQAIVFGLAHGGYGTIIHVLMPLLFGIVAGIVALRFGLWAAIVLHVLVDFYVFSSYLGDGPWFRFAVWTLLVNVAISLAWASRWVWTKVRLAARRA